ncbi:hypothetical protein OROHE_017553 [Orobanche hederae]
MEDGSKPKICAAEDHHRLRRCAALPPSQHHSHLSRQHPLQEPDLRTDLEEVRIGLPR